MNDWRDVAVFGTQIGNGPRVVRPSAYALTFNKRGDVLLERSARGTHLPGGGIDENETPEEALVREVLEECGLLVRVGPCIRRAIQIVMRRNAELCVEKRSYFFEAYLEEARPDALLPGHEALWLPPQAAVSVLTHASHVWVLQAR